MNTPRIALGYDIITIAEIARRQYEEFCASTTRTSPFHRAAWMATTVDVYGGRVRWLGAHKQGRLVGVLPVVRRRLGPLWIHGAPLPGYGTQMLHPLLADDADRDAFFSALVTWAQRSGLRYFQFAWSGPLPRGPQR